MFSFTNLFDCGHVFRFLILCVFCLLLLKFGDQQEKGLVKFPITNFEEAQIFLGDVTKRHGLRCAQSIFLNRLLLLGFNPAVVIDAGANQGEWSQCAWESFQGISPAFFMLEGSEACRPKLVNSGFDFVISVLGAETRIVEYFVNGMSTGNSVLRERTQHFSNVKSTTSTMRTVDELIRQWRKMSTAKSDLNGPILFKLDVQGYEIEVLRGAAETLQSVDVPLLEASIVPWNEGAPLVAKLMSFVDSIGFDVLDLIEIHETHGINIQLDFGFVRKNSLYMNLTTQNAGVK